MSWRAVGVFWVIAVVLGAAAWLTRPRAVGPAAASGPRDAAQVRSVRPGIDPAAVTAIEVRAEGLGTIGVERGDGLGRGWLVTRRGEDGAGLWAWPGDDETIAAGLRRLATSELREEPGAPPPAATPLRITVREGDRVTELAIAPTLIGGRVDGVLTREGAATPVIVDRATAEALALERIAGWRDAAPLRRIAGGPRRIEVVRRDAAGEQRWVLSRSIGRWSWTGPAPDAGEREIPAAAVAAWLDVAQTVTESAILDEPPVDLPDEALVLELTTPLDRSAAGVERVLVQRIRVVSGDGTAIVMLEEREGDALSRELSVAARFDAALLGKLLAGAAEMGSPPSPTP